MQQPSSSFAVANTTSSRPSRAQSSSTAWAPNTDVYLGESGMVIKVELAGLRREDLELSAEGNLLAISGARRDECRGAQCSFQIMEIHYGEFEVVVELPAGYDLGQARASYQNGFLRVDVPPSAPVSRTHGAA